MNTKNLIKTNEKPMRPLVLVIVLAGFATLYAAQHYFFQYQEEKLREETDMLCMTIANKIRARWGDLADDLKGDCVMGKIDEMNQKISRLMDAIEQSEHDKAQLWIKEEERRLKRELQELREKERRKEILSVPLH